MSKKNCSLPEVLTRAGQVFEQQMRITGLRETVLEKQFEEHWEGEPYTLLKLGHYLGSIEAILWPSAELPYDLAVGLIVEVKGVIVVRDGYPALRLASLSVLDPSEISPRALFPREHCPLTNWGALQTLVESWDALRSAPLRRFMAEVFLCSQRCIKFMNCPASINFHHANRGGLFAHVAEMNATYNAIVRQDAPASEQDIVFVLNVLHDLGKVETYEGRRFSERSRYQSHEMIGLELLAGPLAGLAKRDPNAANEIRSFYTPNFQHPRRIMASQRMVSYLDRTSTRLGSSQNG